MSRSHWLVPLLWGLLAAVPARAEVGADSLAAPARQDTVRAGDMTIIGDVQVSPGGDPDAPSLRERDQLKGTLTQLGSREVPGMRQWQRSKVPKVALFTSAALPGLGQLYNGRRIKVGLAAGFFSVYLAGAWLNWKDAQRWTVILENLPEGANDRFAQAQVDFYKETSRDFVWWSAAIWVINILDAWIDAHLFDLRAFTPPADPIGTPQTKGVARQWSGGSIHYLTYTARF
jgi:hypothetical protein